MSSAPTISQQQATELAAQVATRRGATWLQRIDEAAAALVAVTRHLLPGDLSHKQLVVLAGVGNTGAVGLAAARALNGLGAEVRIVLSAKPERLHAMAAHQLALARDEGLEPWGLGLDEAAMSTMEPVPWHAADLLIDALLGGGIEGNPRGEMADLVRLINATRRLILSLDRPTGLEGDEGMIRSPSVDAAATLVLGVPQHAHREGWPIVGELWLADMEAIEEDYAALALPIPADWIGFGGVRHIGSGRSL